MRHLMNFISILLFTFLVYTTTAQELKEPVFTVNLGNTVSVSDQAELASIRKLGFLYAVEGKDGYKSLNLGGYRDRAEAEKVAGKVKETGYIIAVVNRIKLSEDIFTIQLGVESAKRPIDWKKYPKEGDLFAFVDGDQVKITYGLYVVHFEAKKDLAALKAQGFKEAWIKAYNKALLHPLTEFEMNGYKRPFVDVSTFKPSEKDAVLAIKTPDTEMPKGVKVSAKAKSLKKVAGKTAKKPVIHNKLPAIRGKIKRNSAISLQSLLHNLKYYKAKVDGYYGPGTKKAFKTAYENNNQLKKYRLLLKNKKEEKTKTKSELQRFIDNLSWNTAEAVTGLGNYDDNAIALAFRAYGRFLQKGGSKEVNALMNKALKKAFAKKKSSLPYDPSASYAYENAEQLIRHIVWVFMMDDKSKVAVPCWMMKKYPTTIKKALRSGDGKALAKINFENCGGFQNWEVVQVMTEIAKELNGNKKIDKAKWNADRSKLAASYLLATPISDAQNKANIEWEKKIIKNLTAWGKKDSFLGEIATAFKLTYYQTKVLLEDYYMDSGMKDKDAVRSALNALRLMNETYLTRFEKGK